MLVGALAFDVATTLAALAFALRMRAGGCAQVPIAHFLCICLLLKLWLGAATAQLLGFTFGHSTPSYFAATLVFVLASAPSLWAAACSRGASIWSGQRGLWRDQTILAACAIVFTSLATISATRVSEIDSVFHLSSMLAWLSDNPSPYLFPMNYVSFWELAYIPLLTLTKSDSYFWWTSIQAIALFGLAAYCLARDLDIPPAIAVLIASHTLSIHHFWLGSSGISTLKNDMIYNASLLLLVHLVVVMRREGYTHATAILAGVAASFLACKFSGPVILIAFIPVAFFALGPRASLKLLAGASPIVLVSVGHFYIKNVFQFGNPFYPIAVHIGPFGLPGSLELAGTSILSTWNNVEMWRRLLGIDVRFAWSGPLVAFELLGGAIVLALSFARRHTTPSDPTRNTLLVATAGAIATLVYLQSFWSASAQPGDLFYVHAGSSLRYATAALTMGTAAIASDRLRAGPGWSRVVAASLVIGILVRLHHLLLGAEWFEFRGLLDDRLDAAPRFFAAALLLTATFLFVSRIRSSVVSAAVVGFLLGVTFAASDKILAANQPLWMPDRPAITKLLPSARSMNVFVLDATQEGASQLSSLPYPVVGNALQHSLRFGGEETLLAQLQSNPEATDAVVLQTPPGFGLVLSTSALTRIRTQLERHGFVLLAQDAGNAVFARASHTNLAPGDGQSLAAYSFVFGEPSQWPCRHDPPGGPPILPPVLLLSTTTGVAGWSEGSCFRLAQASGDAVLRDSVPGGKTEGSPGSSMLELDSRGWRLNLPNLFARGETAAFDTLEASRGSSTPWSLGVDGSVATSIASEGDMDFTRVRATTPARWFAFTRTARPTDGRHQHTWLALVRSHGASAWNAHGFLAARTAHGDVVRSEVSEGSTLDGSWHYLVMSADNLVPAEADYVGFGGANLLPGDTFDIAKASIVQTMVPEGVYDLDGRKLR